MATREQWIQGARPLTLPAAFAPVLLGTAIAKWEGGLNYGIALLCLLVSVALQVGVNYSNDYSDGIRGTDEVRVGPVRLVGQGLAKPEEVKRAAFICFGIAAAAGLIIAIVSGLFIFIPVGLAAIVAAWFYTGGKNPYGYAGLGELFVFIFFGIVAVVGTTSAQTGTLSWVSILAGISCGALSSAILIANNLRDIETDKLNGKNTLAVKLGDAKTRELYKGAIVLAFLMPVLESFQTTGPMHAYVGLFAILSARYPLHLIRTGAVGQDLVTVLQFTARLLLVFAVISSIAIWFS